MKRFFLASSLVFGLCASLTAQTEEEVLALKKIAGAGDVAMHYKLAQMSKKAEEDKMPTRLLNKDTYLDHLREASMRDYAPAKLELARLLLVGKEVAKDEKGAFTRLSEVVRCTPDAVFTREMLAEAYFYLGLCYERGFGVKPNPSTAFRMFQIASIFNESAQLYLARYCLKGIQLDKEKMPQNLNTGFGIIFAVYNKDESKLDEIGDLISGTDKVRDFEAYLTNRANAGDIKAALLLGDLLLSGKILARQRKKGFEFYQMAADLGNPRAALQFAKTIASNERGIPELGIKKDDPCAIQYFQTAFLDPAYAKEAAKYLADYARKAGNHKLAFRYALVAGNLPDARTDFENMKEDDFSPDGLFLRAKEYQATLKPGDSKGALQYQKRLLMAVNAGSPGAVFEYFAGRKEKDYLLLGNALESEKMPEVAEWLYQMALSYSLGGEKNTRRNPEEALKYMIAAADKGSIHAMNVLARAYRSGNAALGVKPDKTHADRYAGAVMLFDFNLSFPSYLQTYLDALAKGEKPVGVDPLNSPLIRTLDLVPASNFAMAEFYRTGSEALGLPQDTGNAMIQYHNSVRTEQHNKSLDTLIGFYTNGNKDLGIRPDANLAALYKSLKRESSRPEKN